MDCCLAVFSFLPLLLEGLEAEDLEFRPLWELKCMFSESSSACKAQGYDFLYVLFPQKADGRVCTP